MATCLKTHFKSAHPEQLGDLINYKAWSCAKTTQFQLHSLMKKGDLEFAMGQGVDAVINLLVNSGITVYLFF